MLDLLKRDEKDLPQRFRFRKHNDLIYLTTLNHIGKRRLCIPESIQQEVFQIAHNRNFHAGFHTTRARISPSVYIQALSRHLKTYIQHYPECQLNQTKRHPPYGELNPIVTPSIPFHTVAIDFIIGLPYCNGKNILLTITCKFTKRKLLLAEVNEWAAADWANVVLVALADHD